MKSALIPAFLALTLAFFAAPVSSEMGSGTYGPYGRSRVPDQIQINATEERIVAFMAGAEELTVDLNAGEIVRDSGVRGSVGGVVTSDRVMAISSQAFAWRIQDLDAGEQSPDMLTSERLILFVNPKWVRAFDGEAGRLVSIDLPVGDDILDRYLVTDVAVVVTLYMALGFAVGDTAFVPLSLDTGEIFRRLKPSAGMISVVTSNRVASYTSGAEWVERMALDEDEGF